MLQKAMKVGLIYRTQHGSLLKAVELKMGYLYGYEVNPDGEPEYVLHPKDSSPTNLTKYRCKYIKPDWDADKWHAAKLAKTVKAQDELVLEHYSKLLAKLPTTAGSSNPTVQYYQWQKPGHFISFLTLSDIQFLVPLLIQFRKKQGMKAKA